MEERECSLPFGTLGIGYNDCSIVLSLWTSGGHRGRVSAGSGRAKGQSGRAGGDGAFETGRKQDNVLVEHS